MATAQASSPRCEAIKSAVLQGALSETEITRKIGASDFKILLFGENHADPVARAHRQELLNAIQEQSQKKVDCVLLELPRDLQPRINAVLAEQSSFDDFIHGLRPTIAGVSETDISALQGNMKDMLSPAFRFAIDGKIKLIAIDDLQHTIETQESADYEIGKRTSLFKDEILRLFGSQTCTRAIFVVGALHIGATSENHEYKSLNHWMSESGLASISLFSSSVNSPMLNPLPEIAGCGLDIGQGHGTSFGTQVNRKNESLPLFSGEQNSMEAQGLKGWNPPLYNDFDYLLFNP